MKKTVKILEKLERILSFSVISVMIIMAVVTFGQVVLRYVFKAPTIWSEELTLYLFVWLVFLTSAVAIRRSSHIKIDFLINKLKPKARLVVELINTALILIFLVVLLREGILIVEGTAHAKSASLQISMAYPYLAIPIGTALMILFTIEMVIKNIKTYVQTQKEAS